jgi:unsaturated rhamnogalacturonyl hydrolase
MLFTATIAAGQQLPQQQTILRAIRLAIDYFMSSPRDSVNTWNRAVYYEGLMALYAIDPQKRYYDDAVAWGDRNLWLPCNGVHTRLADDQCCGQTYLDLYNIDAQPRRIAGIKASVDSMLSGDNAADWYWADAIQMAMPVFARLGIIARDTACFRKMYDLYHYTKAVEGGHGLYDPEAHLWWRDKNFAPPYREPNGEGCYWSRGNGWALAGLVRVLSSLPVEDPHRAEYLQDYLDLVKALVPLQRSDGFWNVSLRDPAHFGGKELTGTALFTYGIAWGIRQGWLDSKTFLPVVARAWNGMVGDALHPDGALGYIQGIGMEPKDDQPVTYDKLPRNSDFGLGCFLLAGSEVYQIGTVPAANMDESKVPPYQEPDPLMTADGRRINSVKKWESIQRPAIYRLFEKNVYGRLPTVSIPVSWSPETVDSAALDGAAIRKELTIRFSPEDTAARLHLVIYLPRNQNTPVPGSLAPNSPVPVFVGYNFDGNDKVPGASQWPLKEILARGYGVATAWYWDIEPDRPDGWQTGIRTRLAVPLQIEPWEWGAIGAWAWGLQRIADYLVNDPAIDPHRLIAFGHSRLGKTALWAGASDDRFAMVISNESGEGGAALSKRDYGETIAIINAYFPWWFCPAYKQYGSNLAALPLDQHFLLGLIAPRPLYIGTAEDDQWSDPKGQFLSGVLAGPVYRLYKKNGIGTDSMPPVNHSIGEFVHFHVRTGKHDVTLYDWQQYLDFADHYLKSSLHP